MSAYVEVNEVRINAVRGDGARWWYWYRAMAERSKLPPRVLAQTLGGDVVLLEQLTLRDAEWIADYMVSQGVPKSAVKVLKNEPSSAPWTAPQ